MYKNKIVNCCVAASYIFEPAGIAANEDKAINCINANEDTLSIKVGKNDKNLENSNKIKNLEDNFKKVDNQTTCFKRSNQVITTHKRNNLEEKKSIKRNKEIELEKEITNINKDYESIYLIRNTFEELCKYLIQFLTQPIYFLIDEQEIRLNWELARTLNGRKELRRRSQLGCYGIAIGTATTVGYNYLQWLAIEDPKWLLFFRRFKRPQVLESPDN